MSYPLAPASAALLLVTAGLSFVGGCENAGTRPLRLATTTSVVDSGLLDALLPVFQDRTGIVVGVSAVGTGMALELARRGEVDVVITHDPAREERFVAAGHARLRRVFAASDFVLAGPPGDPARVRGMEAAAAFRQIAESGAAFASRGDSSGTHARELALWKAAGLARPRGPGYVEVRAGMATTLRFADERDAYVLSDRATFLAWEDRLELEVLVRGGPLLRNEYAVMVLDERRHPAADVRRARLFAEWLSSAEARALIAGLRRSGEPLFEPVPSASALPAGESRRAGEPTRTARGSLTVSAAISLREALEEVARSFERANPGTEVSLNLGASGDLERQVAAGAPADVLISASGAGVDALAARATLLAATRTEVACNRLVVVTPAAGRSALRPGAGLRALAALPRVVIGNPATVPAGRHAREALRSAGLWTELEPRLVLAENARHALEYVARGEADAGIVYATDARAGAGRVRLAFELAPARDEPIGYVAAAVGASPRRALAERFTRFLSSPAAAGAFERRGFGSPPCGQAGGAGKGTGEPERRRASGAKGP